LTYKNKFFILNIGSSSFQTKGGNMDFETYFGWGIFLFIAACIVHFTAGFARQQQLINLAIKHTLAAAENKETYRAAFFALYRKRYGNAPDVECMKKLENIKKKLYDAAELIQGFRA
jgi:hypothetical protein